MSLIFTKTPQNIFSLIPDRTLCHMLDHHFTDGTVDLESATYIKEKLHSADLFSISQYLLGKEIFEKKIKAIFPGGEEDVFVDFGCGSGNWSIAAKKAFGHVYGFDISHPRIEMANTLKDNHPQIVFQVNAPGRPLPLPDGSVNALLFFNALSSIDVSAQEQLFTDFHRLLKQDGKIYITSVHFGTFPFLFCQGIFRMSPRQVVTSLILTAKALLFIVGITKYPVFWISKKYIRKLAAETGFNLVQYGAEGDCTLTTTKRIFKKRFFFLPFMKEYMLVKQ